MPYMSVQEDDEWTVYKKGPDGKPMGKALGKHKDEAGAKAQMKALYANESKEAGPDDNHEKMGEEMFYDPYAILGGPTSFSDLMAQEAAQDAAHEVHELTYKFQMLARNVMSNSEVDDKAAAIETLAGEYAGLVRQAMEMKQKERWQPLTDAARRMVDKVKGAFGGDEDDREDHLKAVWSTAYVNALPDSSFLYIKADCGSKDSDGKTKPRSCRMFPVKDANGKTDLPHLRNAIARIPQANIPKEKKDSLQEKARRMLADANKEVNDFFIWKDVNGTRRWFATYSNKYRDQDNPPEIISDASHRDFVKGVEAGLYPYPELWLWHVPGSRCGQADWLAYTDEGFALASGTFDKGKEAIADNLKEMGELLTSHGMPRRLIERDEKDNSVITKHITREISPLPAWAAANKLTGFSILKESKMLPDEKKQFLKSAGLSDEQIENIEAGIQQQKAVADEEKLESKEGGEAHQPELPTLEKQPPEPAQAIDQEALALAISGAIAAAVAPIVETVKALEVEVKALKETDEEKIAKQAGETPKASLQAMVLENLFGKETLVRANSALAKSGPDEAPVEKQAEQPFFMQWIKPGN